jgi:hypothetical protein
LGNWGIGDLIPIVGMEIMKMGRGKREGSFPSNFLRVHPQY